MLPLTSQAWHCPVHAVSQHTPSTQRLVAHWLERPQACPLPYFATQMPAAQKLPAWQSLSTVQSPLQPEGPHTNGAHETVCTVGQAPAPLQPDARVAMLIAGLQLCARHE